jgi:hypothetical protein
MQQFTKFFSIRAVGRLMGCDLFFILDEVNNCNRQSALLFSLAVFNISAKFSPIGSIPNYTVLLSLVTTTKQSGALASSEVSQEAFADLPSLTELDLSKNR